MAVVENLLGVDDVDGIVQAGICGNSGWRRWGERSTSPGGFW